MGLAIKGLILNGMSCKTKTKQDLCKINKDFEFDKKVKRHPKPCVINIAQRVTRPFPLQSTKYAEHNTKLQCAPTKMFIK